MICPFSDSLDHNDVACCWPGHHVVFPYVVVGHRLHNKGRGLEDHDLKCWVMFEVSDMKAAKDKIEYINALANNGEYFSVNSAAIFELVAV